jgi:hypothetical protein
LTVWDNKGKSSTANSWFETGFMNPKQEAWGNAKWIGGTTKTSFFILMLFQFLNFLMPFNLMKPVIAPKLHLFLALMTNDYQIAFSTIWA